MLRLQIQATASIRELTTILIHHDAKDLCNLDVPSTDSELRTTRFLRICVPRVILRSLSAHRREKPLSFIYVLAMCMAIQTALFQYTWGRSTNSVMDSDDNLSYTVPSVDFIVTLQST